MSLITPIPVLGAVVLGSVALSALMLSSPTAWADTSGDAVLTAMDDAANIASDTWSHFSATTTEPGKKDKVMEFTVHTLGEKRLVEFLAPGDMKGTRILIMNRTQMYVYLPAYDKIRRVASHVSQQGFMGTTFSEADMSTTHFGMAYTASVSSQSDAGWELQATPKAGEKTAYSRIELSVRKDNGLPSELRYFNDKDQHVKTETRTDYVCDGDACQPGVLKMVDHTRNDVSTTLSQSDWKINTGVDEANFTVRTLQRGG